MPGTATAAVRLKLGSGESAVTIKGELLAEDHVVVIGLSEEQVDQIPAGVVGVAIGSAGETEIRPKSAKAVRTNEDWYVVVELMKPAASVESPEGPRFHDLMDANDGNVLASIRAVGLVIDALSPADAVTEPSRATNDASEARVFVLEKNCGAHGGEYTALCRPLKRC